ncbi:uncharacterized protein si:ch211-149a19.3 isoform X5 [Danio rerio]|uniref:Uncharacterized protein si:ch211-149a19.3 isoform X5 n=1 Tax=Danio rerio TaxID=7955 RepID=A0A8M9PGU5_DANRE
MVDKEASNDGDFSSRRSHFQSQKSNTSESNPEITPEDLSAKKLIKMFEKRTPDNQSKFNNQKSNTAKSIRSDRSIQNPVKIKEIRTPADLSSQRSNPPESSSVSMKSDQSTLEPEKVDGGHTSTGISSQRSNPPKPMPRSIKSDQSTPELDKVDGGHTSTALSQRSNPPDPKPRSIKSDQSTPEPDKVDGGHTSTGLSSQRSNPPESSSVSMKSDQSTLEPDKVDGGHTSTGLSSQRSNPPESSSVSMKSDQSTLEPEKVDGGHTSTGIGCQRSNPPDPKPRSIKSDQSTLEPDKVDGGHTSTGLSSQRSNPPESSSVSMKSDQSTLEPDKVDGGHTSTGISSQRSNPPESSSVSMKSDQSTLEPEKVDGGHTSTGISSQRSNPPESSLVSLKSDQSTLEPDKVDGGHTSTGISSQRSNPPESSSVSMKSDQSMPEPIKFDGGHTPTGLSETSTNDQFMNKQVKIKRRHTLTGLSKTSINYQFMEKQLKTERRHTSTGLSLNSKLFENLLKSNLLKKFQCVSEGTSILGNPTLLNEIYTELYITESDSGEINNEHELRQIETQSRRSAKEDTPIQCRDIFTPLPGQDKAIRTVLTKGVAGIGKTVSVQKFIVDWAEKNKNQDIQLIFPLPFREINLMKDRTLSLSDLLQVFFPETKEMEISSEHYKVLFIFDGLDECRVSLDFDSGVKLHDVSESASVDVLLMNLIMGNLLPSALIWITSRPAAADLIPSGFVHRVTEVRGFNDPQKEEYFRKRIRDQSLADTIISHLKSSRSLHIMCHIPVFCWISATVLEKIFSQAERGEIPKTLTQMYTHFLIMQTNIRHEKDYEEEDKDMILKLGKLAFEQLQKGNLIFYEEDLRECGLDLTEAAVYSGLCTQIFREEFGFSQSKVFCFVHLSIQEHLAALYAHHFLTNNCLNKHWKTFNPLSFLHQRAVNEALQSKNGHLDLFLRFLLGLSLEFNQTLLQELLTQTGSCSYNTEETVQFIKQKIREINSPERSINLFHCLNELGDQSLMKEIQNYLRSGEIKETKLSSSQWSALVYVLLTSEQEMEDFDLNQFIGTQNTADEVLQKLQPVVKESRSVQLSGCSVTDKGCAALALVLRSDSSHLRELDLSENNLRDSGVKLLSDGLKDPHCKLEKLRLSDCGVTDEGCAALASALRSNSTHLTELDLSLNNLEDSGVKLLSDGLKDPHCKLEILRLSDCGVTVEGCADLASALRSNSTHLRELDLTLNNLEDSGVNLLSAGLKDPHCKLEKLRLSDCGFTDEGCADLASALRSNSTHLTELDLSLNNFGDSGVKLLSDGLKDPHCKLEKLRLSYCRVRAEGGVALASALRSNPEHLRELDLSENKLGNSGVKMLSELKNDSRYKLDTLKF